MAKQTTPFETFHKSHERIFGHRSFRQIALGGDGINRNQHRIISGGEDEPQVKKKFKKEICPHCATKNLVRESQWSVKCDKCGYDR